MDRLHLFLLSARSEANREFPQIDEKRGFIVVMGMVFLGNTVLFRNRYKVLNSLSKLYRQLLCPVGGQIEMIDMSSPRFPFLIGTAWWAVNEKKP